METGKFAQMKTSQLQNRKKFASILIVILVCAALLDAAVLVWMLASGKGFINGLFVPAAACLIVLLPLIAGKKKISEELEKRKEH
ncbi:MAG: hypothetical protein U0T82_07735 [Bacteroidales bacterium]